MKRLTAFWLSACFLCTVPIQAQSFIPERDSTDISLFEYTTKIPKRNNVFNLDLEMHASFNTFFTEHKLDEAAFRFNHIKLEATGEINDRLSTGTAKTSTRGIKAWIWRTCRNQSNML